MKKELGAAISGLLVLLFIRRRSDSNTAVSVAFTNPINGQTISGSIRMTASATETSGTGIKFVYFYIDNVPYTKDIIAPYDVNLSTTGMSNGSHKLKAIAYNNSGGSATQEITVTVSNPDTTGPTVTILAPLAGATLTGTIDYIARATDINGVQKVEFYVDNILKAIDSVPELDSGTNTMSRYKISLDTRTLSNGSHTFLAKAFDYVGNMGTRSVIATVSNGTQPPADTTAPTLTINSQPSMNFSAFPQNVTIIGTASDNIAVSIVEVSVNGGIYETASGLTSWSFPIVINGTGNTTVKARAKDAAGNVSATAQQTISVNLLYQAVFS